MIKRKKLTTKAYWESTYEKRSDIDPMQITGYKNHCAKKILAIKEELLAKANRVLEIGGGGSKWLAYLTTSYPNVQFASVDYSEKGNDALRKYISNNSVNNLQIYTQDFFDSSESIENFDVVYSHGVAEHFQDLSEVLVAHARFLSQHGVLLTVIPNMSGLNGMLSRILEKEVYDIHVPHDLASFKKGHVEAGLNIIESGYLCSNNFGVLSSCVRKQSGVKWHIYKFLTRISKAVWLFEEKVINLPVTKTFSPYIYVVSNRRP